MPAKNCSWCEKGECWTHGQIEKPAGAKGGKGANKGGNKAGNKGAGKSEGKADGKAAILTYMMQMLGGGGAGGGWGSGAGWGGAGAWGAGGGGGRGAAAGGGEIPWKNELNCAHALATGQNVTKDAISYTVEEKDGLKGSKKYQATVTVDGAEHTGAPADNKKQAELNAAKNAVKKMYPKYQPRPQGTPGNMLQKIPGQKRSAAQMSGGSHPDGQGRTDPKSKLLHSLQALYARSVTGEDFVFETTETDGKYQCVLTLPQNGTTFTSEMLASKKDAEHGACRAALTEMKDEFATAMEEHEARKKAKKEAEQEAKKERDAAKKAEKEAEEAAKA